MSLSRRFRSLFLALVVTVLGGGGALVTTTVVATPAQALCATPSVDGDWRNINASTNTVTRAVVHLASCGDVRLCDQNGNCTGGQTTYSVRVWGKCSPSDCDWGTRTGHDAGGGWVRAVYSFGFKTSTVWVKTYEYWGRTYLRVYIWNDFTAADGRTDYAIDEWMLR